MSLSICRVSNSRHSVESSWVSSVMKQFSGSLLLLCVTSATRCHSGSLSVSRCYWAVRRLPLHQFWRETLQSCTLSLVWFSEVLWSSCKLFVWISQQRVKKSVWRWDVCYGASERTSSAAGRLDQEQRRSRKDQRFVDEMRTSREIGGRVKSLS